MTAAHIICGDALALPLADEARAADRLDMEPLFDMNGGAA
jgi:hypothetical protein